MQSLLLQDWVTIRGTDTNPVVQAKADWLDLEAFADVVFWVQIAEVANPGTGTVSMVLETAPVPIDSVFLPIDTLDQIAASNNAKLTIRKAFMNGVGGVPLARYLRWKLVGTATGAWDVTFRIFVTVGEGVRSAFCPLALPGLLVWLRADQGVIASAGKVSQWTDLSGNGNHATQSVPASQPTLVAAAINGRPAIDFSAFNAFLDTSAANLVNAGAAYSVMLVAKNGSGALFTIRRNTTYSATKFQSTNTYVHGDGINPGANVTISNTAGETHSASLAFKSCHRYKGTGQNPDVFLNGGAARTITSAGTGQTTESGTLSGYVVGADATAGEAWSGLIAEVIVTSNAISDADRLRVEAYQKDFFGI